MTLSSTTSWVGKVTGKGVERGEGLVGGMSSKVERWWLDDGSSVITRTHTDDEWLAREPDLVRNEATALERIAGGTVAAPRLLAADPTRARLAMTFVEGDMITDSHQLRSLVHPIAEAVHRIAATPLTVDHGLPRWRSWAPSRPSPPAWGDQGLWRRAIDAHRSASEPSTETPVLLHRDLHPLNLLWGEDGSVAVVDWVNACIGHPHAELGHLRWNLAVLAGLDTADRLLDAYLQSADRTPDYDPWWDLAPLMSFLPGPIGSDGWHATGRTDLSSDVIISRTEQFLAAALERG